MSTIKVNNIVPPNVGEGVSIDGLQMPTAGALSNRNLIINGGMSVSQRTTSEAGITTHKYSACDRFKIYPISLGTWTVSQETSGLSDTWKTGATERFQTYFKALCTTPDGSPAAADQVFVLYTVESQDLKCLQYGTTQAKPAVFSFWVKSNKTGNASVDILQYQNSSKQLSTQYTINTANTWEYKTIALPADPAGSFNYDNDGGLQIYFHLNSGSNTTGGSHNSSWQSYSSASSNASNLGVGGTVNDYFAITGVQLEVGSKATPFEHRSIGDELDRCKRYYTKSYPQGHYAGSAPFYGGGIIYRGNTASTIPPYIPVRFEKELRTTPNIDVYNPDTGTVNTVSIGIGSGSAQVAVPAGVSSYAATAMMIYPSYAASTNYYNCYFQYTADAEL